MKVNFVFLNEMNINIIIHSFKITKNQLQKKNTLACKIKMIKLIAKSPKNLKICILYFCNKKSYNNNSDLF